MTAPDEASAAALAEAYRVADAVLYEGYVLYPYRASAAKNQLRWQFGVLAAPSDAQGVGERSATRTECLVEPRAGARIEVVARFLHVSRRTVEQAGADGYEPVPALVVAGERVVGWDEAVPVEVRAEASFADLLAAAPHPVDVPVEVAGERTEEAVPATADQPAGRVVRQRYALRGRLRLAAEPLPGPFGALRLRVVLENTHPGDDAAGEARSGLPEGPGHAESPHGVGRSADAVAREAALRHAFVAAHCVLVLADATFLSLREPPEWAAAAAASCVNEGTWPVLVGAAGDRPRVVLSSPIILDDHPQVAPESVGELYDATEIDEILTLRTLTLTEEEKREARATDQRAAAVIDRVETLTPELLDRLHGTVRYLRAATGDVPGAGVGPAAGEVPAPDVAAVGSGSPAVPWWDPDADRSVDPDTDTVLVDGQPVGRGTRVRLCPGRRRADAQDLFLAGRTATVQAVLFDVEDAGYLAVTLDDDPAAEFQLTQGRFRFFHPDEVEVLGRAEP